MAGLFADEVDVATVADPPIMHAALERTDFAVLAGFVFVIVTARSLPTVAAGYRRGGRIVGKRVGLSVGTTGQFYLYAFLIENGIPADAVQVVDIATKALPAALAERRVDAIASWEPNLLHARRLLGDEAIVFSSAKTYRNTFNLVATKATIADRPEVLTRLLRALMKAEELIAREPAKARAMVARALGEAPANIDDVWDDYAFKVFIDQGLILTLEDEARWELDRRGQVERPVPNFRDISASATARADRRGGRDRAATRIKHRLASATGLVAIAAIVLTLLTLLVTRELAGVVEDHRLTWQAGQSVAHLQAAGYDYLIDGTARAMQQWQANHARLVPLLEQLQQSGSADSILAARAVAEAEQIGLIFNDFVSAADGMARLSRERADLVRLHFRHLQVELIALGDDLGKLDVQNSVNCPSR